MATIAERILAAVATAALDDDALAARLGVRRQAINQACRKLAEAGSLIREVGPTGKIISRPVGSQRPSAPPRPELKRPATDFLSEDEIKGVVQDHLQAQGFETIVAWGRERGIDIDARRPDGQRLIIEAKGEVKAGPQQVNYFLGALGELIQRMADPDARYALALPDNRQYRGLVARLPAAAWNRLGLIVFFVRRAGAGFNLEILSADNRHP